ncbi:hypothetical protein M8J76_007375 [Diaphorina citri]|nr:hypothetical protein M8J76_007375 [Diaphorina citri]KAI5751972.1 hypothetical protein M8J77_012555 [Diaphorina citri]
MSTTVTETKNVRKLSAVKIYENNNNLNNNNNNNNGSLKEHVFPKRPVVDITFKNLRFTVSKYHGFKKVNKEILHGISGEFKAGQLTAIMGPSGAGKSTLLNILAGLTLTGSSGKILVNGQERKSACIEQFLKLSCYIQQDDALRPKLTVTEAMMIASHLKLGFKVSTQEKKDQIFELLEMLGLENHCNTLCACLSGGQKKRLSVALELITNPPILFLDEPTTGLDSSSCSQCVSLLANLAKQGRTVVATIHTPSALLFEKFDSLYALAKGHCIYRGSISRLVPHLASLGLPCPAYHNPADFLMEVAIGEYGADTVTLAKAASAKCTPNNNEEEVVTSQFGLKMQVLTNTSRSHQSAADLEEYKACLPAPAPLWAQAYYLYNRHLTILRRKSKPLLLRLVCHCIIALIFGYLYHGVGDDADKVLGNMVFIYGSNLFLVYTGQMAVLLAFPLELEILKREHFNRWYSLGPYIISNLGIEIPFQILCSFCYLGPSYLMTSQPLELFRFCYFILLGTMSSLVAQSTGFLFGATLPVTIAVFLGPVLMVLFSVFGFAIRFNDIPAFFLPIHYFSFIRATFQSLVFSLYGYGRDLLPCSAVYCHFRNPITFLTEMEFVHIDVWSEVAYVVMLLCCVHLVTALVVWRRLNKR